jgi:hypothetical protein
MTGAPCGSSRPQPAHPGASRADRGGRTGGRRTQALLDVAVRAAVATRLSMSPAQPFWVAGFDRRVDAAWGLVARAGGLAARAFDHVGCGEMNASMRRAARSVYGVRGVAGIRDDLFVAMAQPLGAVDDDRQAVGLMPSCRLGVDRNDHRAFGSVAACAR